MSNFSFATDFNKENKQKKNKKQKTKNNLQNYSEICPKKKNPSFFLFLFFSSSLKASKTQSVKKTNNIHFFILKHHIYKQIKKNKKIKIKSKLLFFIKG